MQRPLTDAEWLSDKSVARYKMIGYKRHELNIYECGLGTLIIARFGGF